MPRSLRLPWQVFPAFVGQSDLPPPLPPLRFALQVLRQLLGAVLPRIDCRPLLIQPLVGVPVEVQLVIVHIPRLEMHVGVGMLGVLVDGGQGAGVGEGLLQVVASQVPRFAGSVPQVIAPFG